MIEKLTRTCENEHVIDAKDHRHEKMVEEINFMRIKNDKFNSL